MNKTFSRTKIYLTRIAFAASYGAKFPRSLGLLIYAILNIQILNLILENGFLISEDQNTLVFHYIRDYTSKVGMFDFLTQFETEVYTTLAWIIFSVYLATYLGFMLVITYFCIK